MPLDSEIAEQTAIAKRKYGVSFQTAVLIATAIKTKSDLILIEAKDTVKIPGIEWCKIIEI